MKFSLKAPYKKLPVDIKTEAALSRFLIGEALQRKYPNGMPHTESRIYGAILDQFYLETDEVEIETAAFNLIHDSLKEAALPANMSSWKWTLLDHLEQAQKAGA